MSALDGERVGGRGDEAAAASCGCQGRSVDDLAIELTRCIIGAVALDDREAVISVGRELEAAPQVVLQLVPWALAGYLVRVVGDIGEATGCSRLQAVQEFLLQGYRR